MNWYLSLARYYKYKMITVSRISTNMFDSILGLYEGLGEEVQGARAFEAARAPKPFRSDFNVLLSNHVFIRLKILKSTKVYNII